MVTAGKTKARRSTTPHTRKPRGKRLDRTRNDGFRPVALAKVTSKGQITIPKNVRHTLQLREGDTVEFLESRGVVRIRRIFDPAVLDKWLG